MDWRSFSNLPRARAASSVWLAAIALLVALLWAGCGRNAVRPSEKEFLADQVMVFDHDRQEAAADEHVLSNREGSSGGRGTSGGGCGCN